MIDVKPMDEGYLHLSCLHDGPIDTATPQPPPDKFPGTHPPHPWSEKTLREVTAAYQAHRISHPRPAEFIREMIQRYGTCAILAWEGQKVVGHLRFFPMKVARLLAAGETDPSPVLDCTAACEPEQDEGTLWVQCVMTCRPYVAVSSCPALPADSITGSGPAVTRTGSGQRRFRTAEEAGARQGIGLKLVEGLISWAREHGWNRIVKVAHCDLDWFYGIQGGGGKAFWEKAGFRVVGTFYKRAWDFGEDKVVVQAQMAEKGMTEEEIWTWHRMMYEL